MRAILLFSLHLSFSTIAQTYNIVDDSIVTRFMYDIITGQNSKTTVSNKVPKYVVNKPIDISGAKWNIADFNYQNRFSWLSATDTTISEVDIAFMMMQYHSIKDTKWQFSFPDVKFKHKSKPGYLRYSVPLFTQDYSKAICQRENGQSKKELNMYKVVNGRWVVDYLIRGWAAIQ